MLWRIKDLSILNLDPMLIKVAEHGREAGLSGVVTSAYRPGDKGVHGTMPVRGLDARCQDPDRAKRVCAAVNERFAYDPERPEKKCAIFHDIGLGWHIHFQVHPNTVDTWETKK